MSLGLISDVSRRYGKGNGSTNTAFFLSLRFFYIYFNLIGVELIYNVVLVSGVQQSDSVIHMHIFIPF